MNFGFASAELLPGNIGLIAVKPQFFRPAAQVRQRLAAAMTFLSNPLTTPFFLIAAIDVGGRIGFKTDLASFMALRGESVSQWMQWLLSDAAPALVSGLFLIGLGVALVGYIVSLVGWRWWVGHKWGQRRYAAREGAQVEEVS